MSGQQQTHKAENSMSVQTWKTTGIEGIRPVRGKSSKRTWINNKLSKSKKVRNGKHPVECSESEHCKCPKHHIHLISTLVVPTDDVYEYDEMCQDDHDDLDEYDYM
jgi:hypothetical protein